MKIMITPEVEAPKGVACQECGKVAAPGQVIFYKMIMDVGYFLWHKSCLELAVSMAPDDLDGSMDDVYTDAENDIAAMLNRNKDQ